MARQENLYLWKASEVIENESSAMYISRGAFHDVVVVDGSTHYGGNSGRR
jgi:hypothetical protein